MRGAGYHAVLLTSAQIRELRELAVGALPAASPRRARVVRRAVDELDSALVSAETPADLTLPGLELEFGDTYGVGSLPAPRTEGTP